MPTTSDIKAYMRHTLGVSEWLRCCGGRRWGGGGPGDSLWGSSLVRSSPGHRGVERPTRERLEVQKGECPKGLEVLRQQSVNESSHKSSKEGWENMFTSDCGVQLQYTFLQFIRSTKLILIHIYSYFYTFCFQDQILHTAVNYMPDYTGMYVFYNFSETILKGNSLKI